MKSFNFGEADAMESKNVIGPICSRTVGALFEKLGTPSSINIPVDVVEVILFRLPVKSLIRFQSACKLWRTIIFDPQFRQIHYDIRYDSNLYWMRPLYRSQSVTSASNLDRLVKVDSKEVKTEWLLEFPLFDASVIAKRSCNGVMLMVDDRTKLMGLWNPSIRKHYCWIEAPPEHNRDGAWNYGFYYDRIIDDYKIAVVSPEYYTIYSCKSGSWSETKPYPLPARSPPEAGFNVDGSSSFYWRHEELGEIVCFDFRDEKLSKLQLPTGVGWDRYSFFLATMPGHLCLLGRKRNNLALGRFWVMEKQNHSWIEVINIEEGELPTHLATPYIVTNEDSVLLGLDTIFSNPRFIMFLRYKFLRKKLKELGDCFGVGLRYILLPYSESLNFPVPEIILQREQGTEGGDTSG